MQLRDFNVRYEDDHTLILSLDELTTLDEMQKIFVKVAHYEDLVNKNDTIDHIVQASW